VQQPLIEGEQPVAQPAEPAEGAIVDPNANPTVATSDSISTDTGAPEAATDGPLSVESNEGGLTRELGEALAFDKLRTQFWSGVRYSAVLLIGVLALFGGKRLFDWVWTQFR
jgi:hypothetical protein